MDFVFSDYAVMPTRTPTGAAVAYFRIKPSAFYIYHVNHASKVCFMTLDSILCDNPPTGVICVFDLEGVKIFLKINHCVDYIIVL